MFRIVLSQVTHTSSGLGAAFGGLLIVYLLILVVMISAWVRILTKAGYSGVWVVLGLIPIVNLVAFLVFAFSDWPALQGRRRNDFDPGPPGYRGYPPPGGYASPPPPPPPSAPAAPGGDYFIALGRPGSPPPAGPRDA